MGFGFGWMKCKKSSVHESCNKSWFEIRLFPIVYSVRVDGEVSLSNWNKQRWERRGMKMGTDSNFENGKNARPQIISHIQIWLDDLWVNSFQIVGFPHPYCWPVGCAGCLVTHKERINIGSFSIGKTSNRFSATSAGGLKFSVHASQHRPNYKNFDIVLLQDFPLTSARKRYQMAVLTLILSVGGMKCPNYC